MNNKLLAAIEKYELLKKGQNVTVALSGGADSVALLHCLLSAKDQLEITVSAAHLNHGIRGDEAERDQAFCRTLCKKWGVELFEKAVSVPEECAKTGESTETCARRLRYEFFSSLSTDAVATAHTASDNAETMLFNLARGCGIDGLTGIPCRRGSVIRPMLDITRSEVEEYCRENSLDFVTDSTNLSDDYTRNYIRHNVVPNMKKVNSAFEENARRAAKLLQEDAGFLTRMAILMYDKYLENDRLSLEAAGLPESLLSRIASYYLETNACCREGKHIDGLVELIKKGNGIIQLPHGLEAQAARGYLRIFKRADAEEFSAELKLGSNIVGEYIVEAQTVHSGTDKINNLLLNGLVDCDKIVGKLVIRNRRAGDSIRPKGRGITKTMKNIFAELDIPFDKRGSFPLVADDKGVIWVPGLNVAERAAAEKGSKNILALKLLGR